MKTLAVLWRYVTCNILINTGWAMQFPCMTFNGNNLQFTEEGVRGCHPHSSWIEPQSLELLQKNTLTILAEPTGWEKQQGLGHRPNGKVQDVFGSPSFLITEWSMLLTYEGNHINWERESITQQNPVEICHLHNCYAKWPQAPVLLRTAHVRAQQMDWWGVSQCLGYYPKIPLGWVTRASRFGPTYLCHFHCSFTYTA